MISFELTSFPKTILLGRRVNPPDWNLYNLVAQNYELIFVYQGDAFITIDMNYHALTSGDFILVSPGQTFSGKTNPRNPCRYYVLHFKLEDPVEILSEKSAFIQINDALKSFDYKEMPDIFQIPSINFKRIYVSDRLALGNSTEVIFNLLEKAITDKNHLSLSSEIMLSCYLCEILIMLSRLTIESLKIDDLFNNENNMPRIIQEAVYFIHDNYTKQIHLKDLCEYLDVSPQYLIRTFNKILNRSPIEYINQFRIFRAKDFLQYTSLTIKEITYEIGMNNPHYFCRLFKKFEGITPSEFRKKGF